MLARHGTYARQAKKVLQNPVWIISIAALIAGLFFGKTAAHEAGRDAATSVVGRAWRGDPSETRAVLGGLLGFQITVIALVLSLNAMVIKSAASQYSPRLIPLYVGQTPSRAAAPFFVFSMAYLVGALRELGLVADDGERPRSVVSIAVVIMIITLALLVFVLVRTFRFVRLEPILGLVRDETFAAAARIGARIERLPLDPAAVLVMPGDVSVLVAGDAGYIVDIDFRRLVRLARRAGVRVRFSRGIGDYVDEGETVGWAARDGGGRVDARSMNELACALTIGSTREFDYDPALGVRIIVDVADKALSSSYNDPYAARQAINQLRSIVRHIGSLPLYDWNFVDESGAVRVSIKATTLRELLALATSGPLHFGGDQPEVLEGLIELVLAATYMARGEEDRAAARALLDRIEGLAEGSDLEPERLARLRAEAAPVRRSLETPDTPRPAG